MQRASSSSRAAAGLLLAGALLSGCGSSTEPGGNGNGQYYMRFRANGTLVEFTQQASLLAASSQSGTQYVMVISGFNANSNFSISLFDNAAITAKTYTGYPNLVTGGVNGALFAYEDDNGVVYSGGAGTINHSATLTEITSSTVRGTFQGTVKGGGGPDVSITSGEFYVQRVN